MLRESEVKKELYKKKTMAYFSHYVSGNLYYKVVLEDGTYQFPISTIDNIEGGIKLSSDLGTTSFYNEIKGSELNRWISISIKNDEFIKIF